MQGKIMILSSQGWIRKRLLVPPSGQKFGHPCQRGVHGNSMGAAEGGDSKPFGGLHAVALKRGGIVPNAPAASTTRRSQGLISGGFSASVGAWLQMPLRR
jgi:hypothetical protein